MPLGYGKYVRSDRVTAIVPIEEERGPGRRTFVFLEDQTEPLVASRAEDSVIRDLVREPQEITRGVNSRNFCEILARTSPRSTKLSGRLSAIEVDSISISWSGASETFSRKVNPAGLPVAEIPSAENSNSQAVGPP